MLFFVCHKKEATNIWKKEHRMKDIKKCQIPKIYYVNINKTQEKILSREHETLDIYMNLLFIVS